MRESILGILHSLVQSYLAEPLWANLIGVSVAMAIAIALSGWFRARTFVRDQISGGPLLLLAALITLGVCVLWTVLDGILYWTDSPLLSEHVIRSLIPAEFDDALALRGALGVSAGESEPMLPGGVSMTIGLILAAILYFVIATIIGSTLSEMLSLQRRPEDIIREERRKKREAAREKTAEKTAASAFQAALIAADPTGLVDKLASSVDPDPAAMPKPNASSEAIGENRQVSQPGSAAVNADKLVDAEEDDDIDPETDGAPLPDDFWGRIYKLSGHFRSYTYVEKRFLRVQKALTWTFIVLIVVGAIPAATGYMPVPMWVGAAIVANAFWMLRPVLKPKKAGETDDNEPAQQTIASQSRPRGRPAFAERSEIASRLHRAPEPPKPPPKLGKPPVHAARVLDDITSALDITALYTHQARAVALFDARRSVLLATAPGSGRQITVDTLAMYALLADGERVLYIAPDAEQAASAHQRFGARAEVTHWKWNVLAVNLSDRAGTLDPSQSQPGLIFADPRAVHRQLCGQSERWQTFLAGVGTVVIPNIHVAGGARAAHATHLLRRLNRIIERARMIALGRQLMIDNRPSRQTLATTRFLLTADPGYTNITQYAERIIGRAVVAIGPELDGAPRPEQDVRSIAPSWDAGGAHPALGVRDIAQSMGYRVGFVGYDDLFSDAECGTAVSPEDAEVIIARYRPANRALSAQTMHLGAMTSPSGDPVHVAVLWQPDPTPMARLFIERQIAREDAQQTQTRASAVTIDTPDVAPSAGRALIAWPSSPHIERSHLRAALSESEMPIDELVRMYSRDCLLDELSSLRADGRLVERGRRLLDPIAGEVTTVHTVRLATSDDVHAAFGLATCGNPWLLCERATGHVLAELEGARARAAAYPLRVFVARGRRFQVLADNAQDQLDRHRILCEQIDIAVQSTPIRSMFVKVIERRRDDERIPSSLTTRTQTHLDVSSSTSSSTPPQAGDALVTDTNGSDAPVVADFDHSKVQERRRGALRSLGGARFSLQHRDVLVTESMTGVRRFDLRGRGLDTSYYDHAIDNVFRTRALILGLIPDKLPGGVEASMDVLHGLAHGFTESLPGLIEYRPEEDLDIAPLAKTKNWSTPSVAFIDLHPGGAGFTEAITLDIIRRLCRHTLDLMRACPAECDIGCPACLHLWTCRAPGAYHQRTDKATATQILEALLGES